MSIIQESAKLSILRFMGGSQEWWTQEQLTEKLKRDEHPLAGNQNAISEIISDLWQQNLIEPSKTESVTFLLFRLVCHADD